MDCKQVVIKWLCVVAGGLLLWAELRRNKRGIELDNFSLWTNAAAIALLLIICLFV